MSVTPSDPATRAPHPDRRVRAIELSEVQLEVLKLYKQGLRPKDLATMYGLDDAEVRLLIFGVDGGESL